MKHSNLFRNRNFFIILVLIAVVAVVFVLSLTFRPAPLLSSDSRQIAIPSNTEPAVENAPADAPFLHADKNNGDLTAAAYVLCTLPSGNQYGIIPLPAEGEISYPIRQTFVDGTQTENILRLTPEGFYMESSTCKNQNCVQQGIVTLENRDERALQNCVICLPNQVMAELYTAEEIADMNFPASEDVAAASSGD